MARSGPKRSVSPRDETRTIDPSGLLYVLEIQLPFLEGKVSASSQLLTAISQIGSVVLNTERESCMGKCEKEQVGIPATVETIR